MEEEKKQPHCRNSSNPSQISHS